MREREGGRERERERERVGRRKRRHCTAAPPSPLPMPTTTRNARTKGAPLRSNFWTYYAESRSLVGEGGDELDCEMPTNV